MSYPYTYDILTDSGCDRSLSQLASDVTGVSIIPLHVTFGTETFPTGAPADDFYRRLTSESAKTSGASPTQIANALRPSLAQGRDVLYVAMASTLSSTYVNGVKATEELQAEFPTRTIKCIDGKCVSGGQGLLVSELIRMRGEGATIIELVDFVNRNWSKVMHIFMLDDLSYLKRGGRIGSTQLLMANMLNVNLVMHFDGNGKLEVLKKVRGSKKAHGELLDIIRETSRSVHGPVWVHYGDCIEDAFSLALEIQGLSSTLKVKSGPEVRIGPVIGAHVGPSVRAIFYWGRGRDNTLQV